MVVEEETRAPMESLLFTNQCVYLSRKHLLWEKAGRSRKEGGGKKTLILGQERHLLGLDQDRTLRLCFSWEVMETHRC